jgi:hypothetical protein
MKSVISKLLLASAFALTVCAQVHAAPTYILQQPGVVLQVESDLNLPINTDVDYSQFVKFDSTLGTLNAVYFGVSESSVSGSLVFYQGTSRTASNITGFEGDIYLLKGVAGAGYNGLSSDHVSSTATVFTNNLPTNVAKNGSATFNLIGSSYLVTMSDNWLFDVTSGNFTGTGYAPTFTLNLGMGSVGSLGGGGTGQHFDYSSIVSKGTIGLVYVYTPASAPVPEPSTYGLGLGALALGAVAIRRRSKAKA